MEFLPAMNSKKMEKRGPKRWVVVTVTIVVLLLISLVTGLLVWHFRCEYDVWWVVASRVIPWEHTHMEKLCYLVLLACALSSSGKAPGSGGTLFPPPCPDCCHLGTCCAMVPALTALPASDPLPSRQERGCPEGFQWPLTGSELGLP